MLALSHVFTVQLHLAASQYLCTALMDLALLSVASSLVIAVAQGACFLVIGVPPLTIETLTRVGLAGAWLATAILATIATFQADRRDHNADRAHWRHVGLGLSWSLFVLAAVLGQLAILGLMGDVCSWCCGRRRRMSPSREQCPTAVVACAEALCLGACVNAVWPRAPAPAGQYQPLPHDPHHPHSCPTGPQGHPTYAPPQVVLPPGSGQGQGQGQGLYPVYPQQQYAMSPGYAPFVHGLMPAPPQVAWGVPTAPGPPQGTGPAQGGYAPPQPHAGAYYPAVEAAGKEAKGGPSAPPPS
eukprot:CAMPEP_0119103660 /NCGR_PEP_ID=MMETSP1180-20130426/2058_1 /TAXON_ID=3052 ORGANISM="Chlamydomonas cf sp, Strain CCMP681" /NCGR_SAMPLE_ID=MMETSP1180 /ASSEMBLY_ACC=CAM_ASM_000741 /LENGTH=298 /DNA_ID=CAMNT_0007088223 /DNA_START=163 /DNA_END=1058 /DNA_ORIENTATION=-